MRATFTILGLLTAGLFAGLNYADQREGHAWCDGASLVVHRPVSECMAQWNTFGADGVVLWAKRNLPQGGE